MKRNERPSFSLKHYQPFFFYILILSIYFVFGVSHRPSKQLQGAFLFLLFLHGGIFAGPLIMLGAHSKKRGGWNIHHIVCGVLIFAVSSALSWVFWFRPDSLAEFPIIK